MSIKISTISIAESLRLVDNALQAATATGIAIAVVVTDKAGNVVASARMDGVSPTMLLVAQRKALTAATFTAPTHAVATMFQSDPLLSAPFSASAELVILPGGLPILEDGTSIGALGIAGGHYSQDQAVAESVLASFK